MSQETGPGLQRQFAIISWENDMYLSEKPKILIVDDKPENLFVMKDLLHGLNVELVMVTSGMEAVAKALNTEFAFVLLDVEMPEVGGFETAEMLRRNESSKTLPIIFVTALDADDSLTFKGYENGAIDFLYKPLNANQLYNKVSIFLEIYIRRIELERSNEALLEFAQIAAHDLRSPVRHIKMLITVLEESHQEGKNDDFSKYIDYIKISAQRMDKLVVSLLSYAKVGAHRPDFEKIDLTSLIEGVAKEFKPELTEYATRIDISKLPTIDCSRFHIHQAVCNIISNALKFRKRDVQPVIKVTGCENEDNETASIIIEDNGIGFDKDNAELIFKPFARAVGVNEFEGAGIGLATVRKILDMHSGSIKAEGALGKGATFTLTLPINRLIL